jgi:hypothetical protein
LDDTLVGEIRSATLELPLFLDHGDKTFAGFLMAAFAPVDGMSFSEFYGLYSKIGQAVPCQARDQWIEGVGPWLVRQSFTRDDMFSTLHGDGSVRAAVTTEVISVIAARAARGETTCVCNLGCGIGQDGTDLSTLLDAKDIHRAMYKITQRDIFGYVSPSLFHPRTELVTGTGIKSADKFDVILG